ERADQKARGSWAPKGAARKPKGAERSRSPAVHEYNRCEAHPCITRAGSIRAPFVRSTAAAAAVVDAVMVDTFSIATNLRRDVCQTSQHSFASTANAYCWTGKRSRERCRPADR